MEETTFSTCIYSGSEFMAAAEYIPFTLSRARWIVFTIGWPIFLLFKLESA